MRSFTRYIYAFSILILIFSGCTKNSNLSVPAYVNISPTPVQSTPQPSSSPFPTPIPSPTPTAQNISISAGGDVIFESYVANAIDRNGLSSFAEDIAPVFKSSDISIINLETAVSTRGEKEKDKQFTFRADPKYLQLLNYCGINIVSLANNHSLDFGTIALEDTMSSLYQRNILYAGAGKNMDEASKPVYINKNNTKVAIIASSHVIPDVSWNAGPNKTGLATTYDPARIITEIHKARSESDIVVCYIHWGEEGKTQPVDYQKNLAHSYIDNGADIVIGSHPHVLQGIEYYKNKIIAYSLGNLVFTDMYKKTAILKIQISNKKLTGLNVIPFEINNSKPVQIKDQEKAQSFYKELDSISFGVKIDTNGNISPKN